jgi:hypothetical protein
MYVEWCGLIYVLVCVAENVRCTEVTVMCCGHTHTHTQTHTHTHTYTHAHTHTHTHAHTHKHTQTHTNTRTLGGGIRALVLELRVGGSESRIEILFGHQRFSGHSRLIAIFLIHKIFWAKRFRGSLVGPTRTA